MDVGLETKQPFNLTEQGIMTFSVTTLGIKGLIETLRKTKFNKTKLSIRIFSRLTNNTQHINTQHIINCVTMCKLSA